MWAGDVHRGVLSRGTAGPRQWGRKPRKLPARSVVAPYPYYNTDSGPRQRNAQNHRPQSTHAPSNTTACAVTTEGTETWQ